MKVPLLRRDFIFEEYQIEESKILGADAIHLVAALEPERLGALQRWRFHKSPRRGCRGPFWKPTSSEHSRPRPRSFASSAETLIPGSPSFEKALAVLKKVPEKPMPPNG
ncbi:MAG: hypothetical protein IPN59_08470 [Holophaga sp.]|nr:hypothetical protein [Holophaga sp.]